MSAVRSTRQFVNSMMAGFLGMALLMALLAGAASGSAQQVVITINGVPSNTVTIPISQ